MRDSSFDRRTLLKVAGTLTAGAALAPALAGTASADRTDIGVSVYPFPLSAVRLSPGPFLDNMNRQLAYFRFIDVDRLLRTFRITTGLSSTAQPCGGWETPTTELRGHSTGHLLSGLAMAYANTGDRLESGGTVWAPYYTLHKIYAGLLDQYQLAGNQQAMDGAIVLAGQYGSTNLSALPTLQAGSLVQDSTNPLRFTGTASTGAVTLLPYYATHHQRYTVYW